MNITIVGTGSMARGIGTRALAGGNGVTLLGKTLESAESLGEELRADAANGAPVRAGTSGDPIADEVVVLAVYYPDARLFVEQNREQLTGKVVVDVTNPIDTQTFDGLVTPPDSSAAEELQQLLGEARVVKAFNTTFAGTLMHGQVAGSPLDVLIAGDDDGAKAQVAQLVEAGGLRAVDAGPLRRALQLEALGFLHMKLQDALGTGFASTVKILA